MLKFEECCENQAHNERALSIDSEFNSALP